MKRTLILLSAMLLCLSAAGGGKEFLRRIHPGVEWGYTLSFATYQHFNYLDPSIGFRIDEKGWGAPPASNAFILGSVFMDLSDNLIFGIMSGWQGVSKGRRTVPVIFRTQYYFCGKDADGFLFFYDFGVNIVPAGDSGNQVQLGSGYNFVLAPRNSVAFFLGARFIYDRPDIWDPIEEEYIPKRNIKRNDAWYCALNIGVALKF